MKKFLQAILFLFIAAIQTAVATVQLSQGGYLCPYWETSEIIKAIVTDADGNPKPFTPVRFSVLPDIIRDDFFAAFNYPLTYTDEQGLAASLVSLVGDPYRTQIEIQAQDVSTGEIASGTVKVYINTICHAEAFRFDPITAVEGSTYFALGVNTVGFYSGTFTAYSTDPRIAVPIRGTITPILPGTQSLMLEISPRQPGQAYLLVPRARSVPITVNAADVNAPVIISQPPTSIELYRAYQYRVIASSPLGKTLTYSLVAGPPGMTMNAQTGALDWGPVTYGVGDHVVKLTVSDGLLTTYQHYRLQVIDSPPGIFVSPVSAMGESAAKIPWSPLVASSFAPLLPTCAIETVPGNGTATVATDCSSGDYQSNPGFIGTDSFIYNATICPTPTGPCYYDSASVTVAVTETQSDLSCLKQFPVSQFSWTGKEGTLTITFTGNITSNTNKAVKICPGTTLKYTTTTSTTGPVVCKVKNNTTRGSGSLKINDHIKCSDKPAGKDKVHFKVKSGVR